jgi:hypothetical protein
MQVHAGNGESSVLSVNVRVRTACVYVRDELGKEGHQIRKHIHGNPLFIIYFVFALLKQKVQSFSLSCNTKVSWHPNFSSVPGASVQLTYPSS